MVSFWKAINRVIDEADIILEVLDARMPEKTRNIEIENKVKDKGKPLIYVLNKSDIADSRKVQRLKDRLKPSVAVSAKDRSGVGKLKDLALSKSRNKKIVWLGVLGYPNTGKSSIINALGGRGKAKTSSESGFTKGSQNIRISEKIRVIDTPGVIPYMEKDDIKHSSTSTIDYAHTKEPDLVVMELMEEYPGKIEKHYGVDVSDDPDEVIKDIAVQMNKLRKGGEPDVVAASRVILKHWQEGKIKF